MVKKNEKAYKKFLRENLGISAGVDSFDSINVAPTIVDPPEDPFMSNDSPQINLYKTDDSFSVHDNSKLYSIVKLFKDFVDSHKTFQSFSYQIDVQNHLIKFTLVTENDSTISEDELDGFVEFLKDQITKRFGKSFEFSVNKRDAMGSVKDSLGNAGAIGKKQLEFVVSERPSKEDKKKETVKESVILESELKEYKGFKIGDRVEVKYPQEAYDNEEIYTEEDVGTIKSFPPKVRIIKRPPTNDGLPYFAYVNFDRVVDKIHNNKLRGGVDICNLRKVKEAE